MANTPATADQLTELLIAETRRRLLDEGLPRIENCLARLTPEQIWNRPNTASNSVGNLVLHLAGNVRQWLGAGLGKLPDERMRDLEFSTGGGLSSDDLLRQLRASLTIADQVLEQVTPEALVARHSVQIYEESGLSILVHVAEHFSYHVGQIAYYTKAVEGKDLGFYAGDDL